MAATIHQFPTARKPKGITHHALYGDTHGTAELLNGSGYLFRRDGGHTATLVSYTDTELVLLGRVDVAPAADARPLWQQIADPGFYEGSDARGVLAGGR